MYCNSQGQVDVRCNGIFIVDALDMMYYVPYLKTDSDSDLLIVVLSVLKFYASHSAIKLVAVNADAIQYNKNILPILLIMCSPTDTHFALENR